MRYGGEVLGPDAAVGYTMAELDSSLEGPLRALPQPLAPRQRHPAAPGRGGGGTSTPTPADRLPLAVCHDWPSLNCQQPCRYCRRNAAAVVRELAEQAGSAKHWHVDQLSALSAELERING